MTPTRYPYVARMFLDLYSEGRLPEVAAAITEPEFGYGIQVVYRSGRVRYIAGNNVGLNTVTSSAIADDKEFTKFFLRAGGYSCPQGQSFVLPWWSEHLQKSMADRDLLPLREAQEASHYAEAELGFPVYVKPVVGCRGKSVTRCHSAADINAVLADYQNSRVRVAVVEESISLPDYRIVVLHGQVISAYLRTPLSVVGDGRQSVLELIDLRQQEFVQAGRKTEINLADERIGDRLKWLGLSLDSVPPAAERIQLLDVSNLAVGGTATDLSSEISDRWRRLAVDITAHFGLALCGIDLACADLTSDGVSADPAADYRVIEVNASPDMDNYAQGGPAQQEAVKDLYTQIFAEPPS